MQKKVLILGAKGMLGQELTHAFGKDARYAVSGWDRDEINVTDFAFAKEKICTYEPDILINAVAYNAVDACEENDEEYEKALLLNGKVPDFLAQVARESNCLFVHYSTDYVFGGNEMREDGFDENVEPLPVCRYAVSKRDGEKRVAQVGGAYYIVRLSKLFGKPAGSELGKKSFFETMLNVGKTKNEVSAVDEEVSCFTYAPDLAQATKELIESQDAFGIYHLPNEMPATWYEGAIELYKQAGLAVTVNPVTSAAFPRPAKRPTFSVLKNTKRPKLRPYTEALGEYLREMK